MWVPDVQVSKDLLSMPFISISRLQRLSLALLHWLSSNNIQFLGSTNTDANNISFSISCSSLLSLHSLFLYHSPFVCLSSCLSSVCLSVYRQSLYIADLFYCCLHVLRSISLFIIVGYSVCHSICYSIILSLLFLFLSFFHFSLTYAKPLSITVSEVGVTYTSRCHFLFVIGEKYKKSRR